MDYKEKINPALASKGWVKTLPTSPGIYIMKDEFGEVLYVGKARNLRKRVSSYFYPHHRLSERLGVLVQKVKEIEHIPTSTEAEALIYENSLIKQFSPKYNVALRDDKSYPFLKLTVNEKFPRLFITRRHLQDSSLYYGPYTNVKLLKAALGILRVLFPLRTCAKMPKSVCLNYHIRQCLGPCVNKIDESSYNELVSELKLFLEGRKTELVRLLSEKMAEASKREDFEEASRLKDRLEALSAIKTKTISYKPMDEVEELRNILGISGPLEAIEAFDISNVMGKEAVGSMIYFYKGKPKKNAYRRFKIKTVSKIDDYAMMREVIHRRFKRLSEEKSPLPNLILIDGGKGHLNIALEELKLLGLSKIPAIGIAKPAHLKEIGLRAGGEFEHIYLKDRRAPLVLPKESKALHLLERIRDESHRFAIAYHKRLLSKNVTLSELDNIIGIGKKRKKALLTYFGSVEKIKEVKALEEILNVKGMDEKTARNIIEYFASYLISEEGL